VPTVELGGACTKALTSSGLPPIKAGYEVAMTSSEENVTPEPAAKEGEVMAPATPGAEALPLPDGEVEKPSDA
jgi:hypothetical protein